MDELRLDLKTQLQTGWRITDRLAAQVQRAQSFEPRRELVARHPTLTTNPQHARARCVSKHVEKPVTGRCNLHDRPAIVSWFDAVFLQSVGIHAP